MEPRMFHMKHDQSDDEEMMFHMKRHQSDDEMFHVKH